MRKILPWLSAAALAIGLAACASEGGTRTGTGDPGTDGTGAETGDDTAVGTDDDTNGQTDTGAANFDPVNGGPDCGFDLDNVGKIVGKHIDNFGLKTYLGDAYWLHQNCGTDKKAVWIILSTGW